MGTILADFTHIAGGQGTFVVGQTDSVNHEAWSTTFNTGGIRGERAAILMFAVNADQGATKADFYINEKKVGTVEAFGQGFTVHTIAIAKAQDAAFQGTAGRDNVIAIRDVVRAFSIKDIVCFFHQES